MKINLEPKDSAQGFRWIMTTVIAVLFAAILAHWQFSPEQQQGSKIDTDAERLFSRWDGSNRALEKAVKESMNDPDSYKHIETTFRRDGELLNLTTTFQGKNAFGGVVTKQAVGTQRIVDGKLVDWKILE